MAPKKSPQTVLAAVADPSAATQVAARKAVELAWLLDADVVLYHASYEPALAGGAFYDSRQRAAARKEHLASAARALQSVADSLAESEVAVTVRVEWQRDVAEAVARAATREGAGLVVAEPRYRASWRQVGLSRIDWEVARLCPVPLLLARSAAPYSKPRLLAAVDPGGHGLRVSSLDAGIVGIAAVMATASDGSVSVVHCVREPPVALAVRPATLRQERRRVATLLRHLARGAGLPAHVASVVDGNPVERILEVVSKDDIDVLVLGTVVRGPIRQALIGSTTEQLLHAAPCDMLLVKPGASRLAMRPAARARR